MHAAEAVASTSARTPSSAAGRAELTFSRAGDRTVVRRAFSTSPLKLLNPQNHSQAAWVYLASYGGGLVDGDALGIDLDVEREAIAVISTQASTKVYRSPHGVSQRLRADVADDALLVLAPDPVVCFARSNYAQDVEIRLAPRAALVLVDWLGAGRVAMGERWQHEHFRSMTQIWCGERRILYDSLRLTPEDGDVAERIGRFNTLLTLVIAGQRLEGDAARVREEVAAMPLDKKSELLISASPLRMCDAADLGGAPAPVAAAVGGATQIHATLIRIAAVSTERAGQTLRRLLAFLPPILGDDPWSRKW